MALEGWRIVESQYVISTMKLVDTEDEQKLLEDLIDEHAKPPVPASVASLGLHYLLYTPFRHPPLKNGSRFGPRTSRQIFYGSLEIETSLTELAYYRLVFLEGTAAKLEPLQNEFTAFLFGLKARCGVDLTRAPFSAHHSVLASKTDYEATQALGEAMRAEGVEIFLFHSARAQKPAVNVGAIEPVFVPKRPKRFQNWVSTSSRDRVVLKQKNTLEVATHSFERSMFLVGGKLPMPATT